MYAIISYKLHKYLGVLGKNKQVCLELGALDCESINLNQFSISASSFQTSHSISVSLLASEVSLFHLLSLSQSCL